MQFDLCRKHRVLSNDDHLSAGAVSAHLRGSRRAQIGHCVRVASIVGIALRHAASRTGWPCQDFRFVGCLVTTARHHSAMTEKSAATGFVTLDNRFGPRGAVG